MHILDILVFSYVIHVGCWKLKISISNVYANEFSNSWISVAGEHINIFPGRIQISHCINLLNKFNWDAISTVELSATGA